MILSRRNWVVKISVLINVCVLSYVAIHVNHGYNVGTGESNSGVPAGLVVVSGSGNGLIESESVIRRELVELDNTLVFPSEILPSHPEQSESNNNPSQQSDIIGALLETITTINVTSSKTSSASASCVTPDCNNAATSTTLPTEKEGLKEEPRLIECQDKVLVPRYSQRGPYWVLYNYIRGTKNFRCDESITYTTHGDYTFLDNLVSLCERWQGPVSVAVYSPGTDFNITLETIAFLRECVSPTVKELVNFHLYFDHKHFPLKIPRPETFDNYPMNCSSYNIIPPWVNATTYKRKKNLTYPVNVGRNIARETVSTHYILPSDIELYPNPKLISDFLQMLRDKVPELERPAPKVFVLSIFEVEEFAQLPKDKHDLIRLLKNKTAIPFHQKVCPECHKIPKAKEWMTAPINNGLHVFHIGKRHKPYHHWEPIFIGTNAEPFYDERLSWEGKSDKMTQGYALCVMDYEFHILDNAFLVHRPGIKKFARDSKRQAIVSKQTSYIRKIIFNELKRLYGTRPGCII